MLESGFRFDRAGFMEIGGYHELDRNRRVIMQRPPARHQNHGTIVGKFLPVLGIVVIIVSYVAIAGSTGFCPTCTAIVNSVSGRGENVRTASLQSPASFDSVHQLVMEDLQGRPVALKEFAGRPMLIDVWATWCAPCLKSRKLLESIADDAAQYGSIVSVSIDQGGASVVNAYIRDKEGGSTPFVEVLNTDPRFRAMLKPHERQPTIPKLVYVDASGRIIDIEYGVADPDWVLERLKSLSPDGTKG
jgi:thiol-disulfide isomerase/thioredoxin